MSLEWVSDGVRCQLLVSSFGLVKVQSRSRTVVAAIVCYIPLYDDLL